MTGQPVIFFVLITAKGGIGTKKKDLMWYIEEAPIGEKGKGMISQVMERRTAIIRGELMAKVLWWPSNMADRKNSGKKTVEVKKKWEWNP